MTTVNDVSPHMRPVERDWCFAISYGLSTSSGMLVRPLERLEEVSSLFENEGNQGASIIYLRGYPSPQWLSEIGAALHMDPALFQRRFDLQSPDCSFFSPPLPSAEGGILHLRSATIGRGQQREHDLSQAKIDSLRKREMDEYLHVTATGGGNVGDSVVRAYHTHNAELFSIEQQITISVQYVGSTWTVLVWSDAGRDLREGHFGPWRANEKLHSTLISADFGKSLDKELMFIDAFYSVHEIFRFCAFSTSEFLKLIDYTITSDIGYAAATDQQYKLSNLLYHQGLLETQTKYLRTAVRNIKQRGDPSWPRAPEGPQREKTEAAAESLLRDYEELLTRASEISEKCKVGVSVTMSLASTSQAKINERLTLLAFFYIPLSFTTSFFGMNLGALGTGELPVWVWFAVSVPVLLLSFGLLKIMTHHFHKRVKELKKPCDIYFE